MVNHPCLRNQWIKRKQDESPKISDENSNKAGSKNSETEPSSKRGASLASMKKSIKQDFLEDDGKSGKAVGTSTPDKGVIYLERRQASLALTKASPDISANCSLATETLTVLPLKGDFEFPRFPNKPSFSTSAIYLTSFSPLSPQLLLTLAAPIPLNPSAADSTISEQTVALATVVTNVLNTSAAASSKP
uniref:Uncharacterized protein n=1 Tax=Brassica oleracea var. oleracea TaxID=109376 RepID=A0A0D3E344_BRAOL